MALLFVLWVFMYCGCDGSSRLLSQPNGEQRRQTIAEIGSPVPWFRCESWPDDTTMFRWEFRWYWWLGYAAIGYLLSYAYWRIETAKAATMGRRPRWWHGSPTFLMILFLLLTSVCVAWGLHPMYLK